VLLIKNRKDSKDILPLSGGQETLQIFPLLELSELKTP